jgi:acetyltransferase-like isoleucine patch superfamily enzyme
MMFSFITGFWRWFLIGFYRNPVKFWVALFRSVYASWRLCGRIWELPVRVSVDQPVYISRHPSAKVVVDGILSFVPWGGGVGRSSVILAENSELIVSGNFVLGQNVHISLARGARLSVGGRKNSSGSGITCNSRIMVAQKIDIGYDTIIAWNVFITDSDWHEIDGAVRVEPVFIGDNVWIAHDCSILKGSSIPSGCVVSAKSLVVGKFEKENALLAGQPAIIRRENISWKR